MAEKKIYCPICGRKVGTYDGKSKINKIMDCKKCRKRIIYHVDTDQLKVKQIPQRNTSSGVTFH